MSGERVLVKKKYKYLGVDICQQLSNLMTGRLILFSLSGIPDIGHVIFYGSAKGSVTFTLAQQQLCGRQWPWFGLYWNMQWFGLYWNMLENSGQAISLCVLWLLCVLIPDRSTRSLLFGRTIVMADYWYDSR